MPRDGTEDDDGPTADDGPATDDGPAADGNPVDVDGPSNVSPDDDPAAADRGPHGAAPGDSGPDGSGRGDPDPDDVNIGDSHRDDPSADEPDRRQTSQPASGTGTRTSNGASDPADQSAKRVGTDRPRTKGVDEMFCPTCGEIVKRAAEICPSCGVRQSGPSSSASKEKDPGIAAVLSALTGGWGGQIYNGQIGKGIALLVVQFVNVLLVAVFIGFLTGFVVWVLAIYDAYTVAQKINRGEYTP